MLKLVDTAIESHYYAANMNCLAAMLYADKPVGLCNIHTDLYKEHYIKITQMNDLGEIDDGRK